MPRTDADTGSDPSNSEPENALEPALDPPVEGLFVAARPGAHIITFDEVRAVMDELRPAKGWTVVGSLPGLEWSVDPAKLRTEGGALELRVTVVGEPRVVAERIAPAAAQLDATAPVNEASASAGKTLGTRPVQPTGTMAPLSGPQLAAVAPVRVADRAMAGGVSSRTVAGGASSRTVETLVLGDRAWDVPVPEPAGPNEIRKPPALDDVLVVVDVPQHWPVIRAVGLSAGGARERVVRFPEDEPGPP